MTKVITFKSNNLVCITSQTTVSQEKSKEKNGNVLIVTIQILDFHAFVLREVIFLATYKENTLKPTLWEATPIQASYDSPYDSDFELIFQSNSVTTKNCSREQYLLDKDIQSNVNASK